jgi:hypothetical protein
MIYLNGLSDNQIRAISLRGEGGGSFDPNVEWLTIHLRCGVRKFVCVNDGENSKNCHIDEDGKLVLDIPSRTFKRGVLEYMVEIREDSQYFKDGYKNTFSKEYKPTGIEIV